MFLINRGEIDGRIDPDMILYRRKLLTFNFPVKPLKMLLRDKAQYGSNQSGVERIYEKQARYVKITDIDEYGLLKNNLGATAELVEKKYLLKNNDILFARSGATVGKAYLHKSESVNYECFFAGYMIRLLVDDRFLLPDFLFYYTQLSVYKEWTLAIQRASGQPNINAEEYKSLSIPLPPKEIQTEIISIFETAYNAKKQKETEAAELLASIDGYLLNELGITLPPPSDKKTYFMSSSRQVSGGRFDPFYHLVEFDIYRTPISKYPNKKIADLSFSIQTGLPIRNDFRVENGLYPYYGANGIIGYMNEFTHDGKYLVVAQDGYIGNHYVVEERFWATIITAIKLDETQANLLH